MDYDIGGSKEGTRDAPLSRSNFSISCSFQEKIVKIIGWNLLWDCAPPPPPVWEILDPPLYEVKTKQHNLNLSKETVFFDGFISMKPW